MNSHFEEFMNILELWLPRGEKRLADGTRLICPTPNIAPEAWLHAIFPPLSEEKIRELEAQCGIPLPEDLGEFLLHTNGVYIFTSWIDVWGVRRSYERVGDASWQPYDLLSHNAKNERPTNSPDNILYFGSDDDGASWCFFEPKGDSYKVGKTRREYFRPSQYWPGFWEWLLDETHQLATLYDKNGVRVVI